MSDKMNFFDGDISKADITNALSRILVLLIAIVAAAYIFSLFQDSSTELDLKMNPYYLIAQNENLSQATRADAMNKITELSKSQAAASFGKRLFQTLMMLFALTVTSSLIAFGYTKIKWTSTNTQQSGFQQSINLLEAKIKASITIFTTVFIAGSLILIALSI